jgi:hypothetical protein
MHSTSNVLYSAEMAIPITNTSNLSQKKRKLNETFVKMLREKRLFEESAIFGLTCMVE